MKRTLLGLLAILLIGTGMLAAQPTKDATYDCSVINVDGALINGQDGRVISLWAYSNAVTIDVESSCTQELIFEISNIRATHVTVEGADGFIVSTPTKLKLSLSTSTSDKVTISDEGEGVESFKFVVAGDNRDGPETFSAILQEIDSVEFAFCINTGDIVPSGRREQFVEFMGMVSDLSLPLYVSYGNHELNENSIDLATEFLGGPDYSFDYGNTHFIILDNSHSYVSDEQYDWMSSDIQGTDKANIILTCHVPPYDPREGESHSLTGDDATRFTDFVSDMGIDVVLNGHIHLYDHRYIQGVEYVISGGAGAPLYAPEAEGGFFHYVIFSIDGTEITHEVFKVVSPEFTPEIAYEKMQRSQEMYDEASMSFDNAMLLLEELQERGKDVSSQEKMLLNIEKDIEHSQEMMLDAEGHYQNDYWHDSIVSSNTAYSYAQQANVNLENVITYLEEKSKDDGPKMSYIILASALGLACTIGIILYKKKG